MNKRDYRLDILKGVAAILVVLGHNIQLLGGSEYDFYSNYLFRFIYMFHMPLFMLISGYLFSFSVDKYSANKIVKNKVVSLLLPVLTWSFLAKIILILLGKSSFSVVGFGIDFMTSLWFLWAVFYVTIAALIIKKYLRNNILFHLIILIILLLLPDILNKELYAFMYPYFVIGFYSKNYITKIRKEFIYILSVLFLIMFIFWSNDYYIYTTGISIIKDPVNMIYINLYRWIAGFIGSIIVIYIISVLYSLYDKDKFEILIKIGMNSLAIYILDVYISLYIFPNIKIFIGMPETLFSVCMILMTPVVLLAILSINKLIKSNKVTKLLFLGTIS